MKTLREKLEHLKTHTKKRKNKTEQKINELIELEKELEHIQNEFTTHAIELIINNKTSLDGFLWQKELIKHYKFSAYILGMLDFKIEYYRNEIFEHTENFEQEKLQQAKKMYRKFQHQRKEATLLYQQSTSQHELSIIRKTLSKSPSYEHFRDVYEDFAINHYQLELQTALIESYTEGYTNASKVHTDSIFKEYQTLADKLIKNKQKNKKQIEQIKQHKTKQKTHQ